MIGKHIFTAFAATTLIAAPFLGIAQETIVDEFGTEYLVGALPADLQAQVIETQAMGGEGGPLKLDEQGRYFLNSVGEHVAINNNTIVGSLCGIVLVPSPGDVKTEGWYGVEGVWHDMDDLPPRVGQTLQGFLYQPVSLESLDKMVLDVKRAYKQSGRPIVDVVVPEQDITSGVVQLVVIESTVGNIRFRGTDLDNEEYIRNRMRLKEGDKIRSGEVLRDLSWMNRSPYQKVNVSYLPGYDFGTSEVIFDVEEGRKIWVYTGYENSGTENLGEDRFIFGVNWGEIFGPDSSLSYQFTTDFDASQVQGHSLIYNHGLANQHSITLIGAYSSVDAEVPNDYGGVTYGDGDNAQLGVRYSIPLASRGDYAHGFDIGFDYKSIDNDLEYGGDEFYGSNVSIAQFSAGYNSQLNSLTSTTEFDARVFGAPGGMGGNNSDRAFEEAGTGASADYLYATLGIEHNQRLYSDFSLRLKGRGQVSSDNLLASEQLGGGGYDSVRGFDQRVALGDNGFIGNIELYTPEMSFARLLDWENESDSLRFLTFYDVGVLGSGSRPDTDSNQAELQSIGVGLRWTYSDWFRLRFDYGHPVSSQDVDDVDDGGRFHIGATANF